MNKYFFYADLHNEGGSLPVLVQLGDGLAGVAAGVQLRGLGDRQAVVIGLENSNNEKNIPMTDEVMIVMMTMTWINRGSVSNSIFLPSLSQLMSRLRSVSATALQRKVAVSPASTSYGCGPWLW